MPRRRQRRAHVVALGGVVVDHVEDHLDARVVQVADHRLELLHLVAGPAAGHRVAVVRGQEGDGVVAPVVGQALVLQVVVVEELVHRHQLDRRDAEPLQVVDHHRVREAGVGAAHLLRDLRVRDGQPAHVRLVDHRLVVGDARRAVGAPVEERVDHHRLRHVRRRVGVVAPVRVAERVAEHGLVPDHRPVHGLGVRVDQQLVRVAAQALGGGVGPVHPVAVALAGLDAGQVAVPDEPVHLGEPDPGLLAPLAEQAELHPLRDLGEDREVGPGAVVGGAERVGMAGPRPHGFLLVRRGSTRRGRGYRGPGWVTGPRPGAVAVTSSQSSRESAGRRSDPSVRA